MQGPLKGGGSVGREPGRIRGRRQERKGRKVGEENAGSRSSKKAGIIS